MGLLDDQLAFDAANAFADTDGFAESITYTPFGASAVTINAIVFRFHPEPVPGARPAGASSSPLVFRTEVFIPSGQGVTAIDKGGDVLSLPIDVGGTAVQRRISAILNQDPGGWLLLLK